MKRMILLSALLLATAIIYAASPLEDFLSDKSVNATTTSVYVQDLASGKVIAQHNADTPLLPASIMKAVTIAGLLNEKGPDERFHTRVYIIGKVHSGELQGDLLIEGGGDPTLGADCLPESADITEEIIAALRHRGIEKIEGSLKVDTSLYTGPECPPSWVAEDRREAYGTGSHALNFHRNAENGRSVGNPAYIFLCHLRSSLENAGIHIAGNSQVGCFPPEKLGKHTLLTDHESDSYAEVMRSCMMRSDNMFAENLLRTFALCRGREGATAEGAEEMMRYWNSKGISTKDVNIVDGSGLSRSNRVTSRFMAAILKTMYADDDYSTFLPLAGQEGTLSDFLKDTPLDSYLAMKTGSMRGIQCYAGYKLDDQFAPTHTVVIIMNGIGKRQQARAAAEELLLRLFTPQ